MQIQQNSCLHCRQFMWLHPWFFSMRVLHLGHFFVFDRIQFAVSLSLLHLWSHFSSWSQFTGA